MPAPGQTDVQCFEAFDQPYERFAQIGAYTIVYGEQESADFSADNSIRRMPGGSERGNQTPCHLALNRVFVVLRMLNEGLLYGWRQDRGQQDNNKALLLGLPHS